MTNKNKTTLYVGVTNNLGRRVSEHKNHNSEVAFTARYNLEYCVFYEYFLNIEDAIKREKQLKKWNRIKKDSLISMRNPEWKDLFEKEARGGISID